MYRTFRQLGRGVVALAVAAIALAPTPVLAADEATDSPPAQANQKPAAKRREVSVEPLDGARIAIHIGNYAAARKILAAILEQDPSSTEALFLMGEVESEQGKFTDAIPYYRKILVDHPKLVRVRLDLARALFETSADDQAEYNFHLALAEGNLPDTVIDKVERYLAILRSRRHFVWDINLGVAPSTNVNAAPTSSHVTIYGLPFALSQQARQQSGIGITGSISGEYRADILPDLRWRTGAQFYALTYPNNKAFDDAQARGYMGPQWFFTRGDISVLGVAFKRSYGEQDYSDGVGGRLEGQYWLTKQFLLSSYLEGVSTSYKTQPFLDGYYVDEGNFLSYYLTPSSFIRGSFGIGYQAAESNVFENWYYHVGVAYQQEFAWGITANVGPEARWANYTGVDPLFGTRRSDRQYFVKLSVYKRDFTIFGFAPVFSYSYTTSQSNQPLYKFNRNQFQLGFTRQF